MTRTTRLLAVTALSLCACAGAGPEPSTGTADVVFLGEHILTVDDATAGASAVAVRGDRIVAVGDEDAIAAWVGPETRQVALGQHALVPGFIDAHGHIGMAMVMLGFVNLAPPPVGPAERIEDVVAALSARLDERELPAGEWLFGFGYDDSLLAERRHPTREDLDRVSTTHPIGLIHVSGHLATLNSAGLAAVGIGASTPNPEGGVIRRQADGREPNGVLEETAAMAVMMTVFGEEAQKGFPQKLARGLATHAGYGITTVQDGASSPEFVGALRQIAAHRPLLIDVAAFPHVNALPLDAPLDSIGYSREYENGIRVAGVKFALDGSPQGRTAWMTQPYTEGPPGAADDYTAYPTLDPDTYETQVARMLAAGIPVLAHANGDAAIDLMIAGIDAVEGAESLDHRAVAIHAQLARKDQLDAMRRLGIVPSFFAAHPFFWGDWHRISFGDARALGISPLRSSHERGLVFTIHNDAPVVPPDIMRLLQIAVTRTTRSGFVLGADERISFERALRAVTLDAAYAYFEEDTKGSITVGKRADLVILERDPRDVDAHEIADVAILETFARGQSVYRRDASQTR